jgi:hypothetical protein
MKAEKEEKSSFLQRKEKGTVMGRKQLIIYPCRDGKTATEPWRQIVSMPINSSSTHIFSQV